MDIIFKIIGFVVLVLVAADIIIAVFQRAILNVPLKRVLDPARIIIAIVLIWSGFVLTGIL